MIAETQRRGRPLAVFTAGGTRENVDDVRYLSNVATGALPAAMAELLLARGWDVIYVHGPNAALPGQLSLQLDLSAIDGDAIGAQLALAAADARARQKRLRDGGGALQRLAVYAAADALATLAQVCRDRQPQLVACAMAVADFAPRRVAGKLASRPPTLDHRASDRAAALTLTLDATEKVIDCVRKNAPHTRLLGFKLLSGGDEAAHQQAAAKLAARSGADWVFSNDMSDYGVGRRRGVVRDATGSALTRLEGGEGDAALERLAAALVDDVVARIGDLVAAASVVGVSLPCDASTGSGRTS